MSIYEIPLDSNNPNVEFDVIIENIQDNIRVLLQTVNNVLLMSVFVNSEQLGEPFICHPNQEVIPYQYMVDKLGGNFIFKTEDDNYPHYENFGSSCNLFFVTADEIA